MSFLKHFDHDHESNHEPNTDRLFDDALALSDLIYSATTESDIAALREMLQVSDLLNSDYDFLETELQVKESAIIQENLIQNAIFAESLDREDLRVFLAEMPELMQFEFLRERAVLDDSELALWGLDILDRTWALQQGNMIPEEIEAEITAFIAARGDERLPDLWLKILAATEYAESNSPEDVNYRVWELYGLNDQEQVIVLLPGEYDKNYGVENWFEREVDARQYIEDIGAAYFDVGVDDRGGFFVVRTKERFETAKHTKRSLSHGQHVTKYDKGEREH